MLTSLHIEKKYKTDNSNCAPMINIVINFDDSSSKIKTSELLRNPKFAILNIANKLSST